MGRVREGRRLQDLHGQVCGEMEHSGGQGDREPGGWMARHPCVRVRRVVGPVGGNLQRAAGLQLSGCGLLCPWRPSSASQEGAH